MLWVTNKMAEQKEDMPAGRRRKALALSIGMGLLTILGPALLIPECPTGQPTPSGKWQLTYASLWFGGCTTNAQKKS